MTISTVEKPFTPLIKWHHSRGGVWIAGYHIIWCFKYRKKLFDSHAFREAAKFHIGETCKSNSIELIEIEMDRDHVHTLVSFPPKVSGASAAKFMKGYSSRKLREGFPESKYSTGEKSLWSPSYFFGTVGQVTAENIAEYIRNNAGKSDDPAPSP
jgi:putative transposase